MHLPPKLFQVATQTRKKTSTLGTSVCLGYSRRSWLKLPAWPNHQQPSDWTGFPELQVILQWFFKIQVFCFVDDAPSLGIGINHEPHSGVHLVLTCHDPEVGDYITAFPSFHQGFKSYLWSLSSALLPCVELAPVFSGTIVTMVTKQPGNTPSVVWHRSEHGFLDPVAHSSSNFTQYLVCLGCSTRTLHDGFKSSLMITLISLKCSKAKSTKWWP